MKTRSGAGRPSKFKPSALQSVKEYTEKCLSDKVFPTIEGCASHLGIGTRTLYDWQIEHDEFLQTMDQLRDVQRQLLITNGLTGGYNTRFSMFLLRSLHGVSENEPLVSATQNNYLNISPDLLADALELMKSREER